MVGDWLAREVTSIYNSHLQEAQEQKMPSCTPLIRLSVCVEYIHYNIQLFPEGEVNSGGYSYFEKGCRKKVHATILKGIVGDFKCTVFQGNLKESYRRPLIYVCEC